MQIAFLIQRYRQMSYVKLLPIWVMGLKTLTPVILFSQLLYLLAPCMLTSHCTKPLHNVEMLIIQYLIWLIFKIYGASAHLPRVLHLDLRKDQLLSPVQSHRQSLLSIHPTVSLRTAMTRSSFKCSSRELFPLRKKVKFVMLMVLSSAR